MSSTLVILGILLVLAAILPTWPLRLVASIAGGFVLVRAFIIYHDYMHGALLSDSRLARIVLYSLGLLMLTPPRHWRFAHSFHHARVGKVVVGKEDAFPILTSDIGSFPLMSAEKWKRATTWQRLRYRISRHPLTILFAYVTIQHPTVTSLRLRDVLACFRANLWDTRSQRMVSCREVARLA